MCIIEWRWLWFPGLSSCLLKFQGHWICLTFLRCVLSNKLMIEWRWFEWSWKGFPGFSSCTLKFQGHCQREKAQHFLSKLATNIFVYPHLSQIFHPSFKYASLQTGLKHSHLSFHFLPKSNFIPFLDAVFTFCQNIHTFLPNLISSLFLHQLRLTAPPTKIFGPKIIVSPHMLGTTVTNERKEQCQVKLVMLTFTEWLCPPTPFDALTPEFQRLGWTSESGWGVWR